METTGDTFIANTCISDPENTPGVNEYYRFLPHYTLVYESNEFAFTHAFSGCTSLKSIKFPRIFPITTASSSSLATTSFVNGKNYGTKRLLIRLPNSYTILVLGSDKSYFYTGSSQTEQLNDPFKLNIVMNSLFPLATKKEKLEIYKYITSFLKNNYDFPNVILNEKEKHKQISHDYSSFEYDEIKKEKDFTKLIAHLSNGYIVEYDSYKYQINEQPFLSSNTNQFYLYKELIYGKDIDNLFPTLDSLFRLNRLAVCKDEKALIEITHRPDFTHDYTVEKNILSDKLFTYEQRIKYLDPISCFAEIQSKCPKLKPIDQCKVFAYIQKFIASKMRFESLKKINSALMN